jgi:peroxiredoxin
MIGIDIIGQPSLADRIAELTRHASSETVRAVVAEIEKLTEAGVGTTAPRVGDRVPGFTLPDARGGNVSLAEELKRGPAVIAFYRGGWCPYCDLQLRSYQEVLPRIRQLGASVIAISPQTLDATLSTAQKKELAFAVLSDRGNQVARAYGLAFKVPPLLDEIQRGFGIDIPAANGDTSNELPVTATFVVATDGRVGYRHLDVDWRRRLEPAELLRWLEQLQRRQ